MFHRVTLKLYPIMELNVPDVMLLILDLMEKEKVGNKRISAVTVEDILLKIPNLLVREIY
jgi:hypothetical protein